MYTLRNWTWFEARLSSISNQILWVDDKPHAQRALQTIGLPSRDRVGQLGFVSNNDRGAKIKIRLGFSENEPKGYAWYIVNDKTVSIPYRAEELYLNLPVWNADLDQSVAVRLEVKILQSGNTTPAYAHTEDITLGTDKDPHWFEKHIPVCSFSKSTGSNNYTLQVKLYKGSVYQDGYAVDFTTEEGPFICSLSPVEGEAGTAVTITGRGFGANQESGKVTFKGVPAREIISWSPTSIIARVPGGATNGDVTVTVEGKGSNGVPFEVKPTDLVFPVRISFVSGENHNMEELNNRKGRIRLGTCATGLYLSVDVQNQYGGYDFWWSFINRTQQGVIEDTSYWLRTQDMVETVDLTGAGFLAKLVSDFKTAYKGDRGCYSQTIDNAQIEGTVSNGRASGTIHWDRHDVNTCTSLDDSLYYNYSFVPDN
ncbi:MAG: Cyclomaltodextrin glucanotransferase precursor [Firmicutes bacterium ADurb.Bin456]|nr:MAG: Cyclomaltodextrin glucanotransferase precursor [Firmicutes bacterium ADurb.Bin456]